MSALGTVASTALDTFTFGISMIVKAFSGKTIGDYVTGNNRPPSTNGFLKGTVSFVADALLPTALAIGGSFLGIPPIMGIVAGVAGVLGTKALTGNTLGDYLTGDTNEARQQAQNNQLEADYMQGQQLAAQRQAMQQRGRQQDAPVSAPNVGERQQMQVSR